MVQKFMLALLISFMPPNLVNAEPTPPVPDVIDCLKSVESLEHPYRAYIQMKCIGIAGDVCVEQNTLEASCISGLTTSLRDYYAVLAPLLPPSIEGSGFVPARYARGVAQAADTFNELANCSDLSGYEFAFCEYIELGVSMQGLFRHARQAGVSLP